MTIVRTDDPAVIGAGIYHSKLKKVDGEWKLDRRQVTVEHRE